MKDVLGMIYTGENDSHLRELTLIRAIAALPIAGRYRIIDFFVSSLVNSNIRNVGVIMQRNYHSLMDHLGSGKEWDLHSKSNGLFILPPFLTRENIGVYEGLIDAIRSNTNYLNRSKQKYVLLTNSNMIYNIDYSDLINRHFDRESDITLLYSKDPSLKRSEYGVYLQLDDKEKVIDMEIEPSSPSFDNTFLNAFVISKKLLMELVDQAASHGYHDFNKDILQRIAMNSNLVINTLEFKEKVWLIDSVQAFYKCNMDLLEDENREYLFSLDRPIYTKIRDEMPSRYFASAKPTKSLIADGCYIEGHVENSILFRGVTVEKDAYIKNCIVMQDGLIESGAYIENCILDKQAIIKGNTRLIGPPTYPIVISKNVVV